MEKSGIMVSTAPTSVLAGLSFLAYSFRPGFGYLIGCASIPMGDGGVTARAISDHLNHCHPAPADRRVRPRRPLPPLVGERAGVSPRLPPLLKAYMRLGATVAGEPCWDPAFGCADLFILLESADLQARYLRHFVERRRGAEVRPVGAHIAA
ncbi:MAG: hypothetical protein ACOCPR_03505 [Guyparkeria sp.]